MSFLSNNPVLRISSLCIANICVIFTRTVGMIVTFGVLDKLGDIAMDFVNILRFCDFERKIMFFSCGQKLVKLM